MSILTDVDIKRVSGKSIVIHPCEDDCITALGYDLRIGYAISLRKEDQSSETITNGKLILPSSSSTLIICKEHIWLSPEIVGTLHSKGSLSAKGLIINSTTVDPNWKGQMTFLLHNSNEKDIELDPNASFMTLILHEALSPTKSRSERDPLTVASDYGDLYGETFKTQLLSYYHSEKNRKQAFEFDDMVQAARSPGLQQLAVTELRMFTKKGKKSARTITQVVLRLLIMLFLLLDLTALVFSAFFWVVAQKLLHLTGLHDPKVIIAEIGLALPMISSLLQAPKVDTDKRMLEEAEKGIDKTRKT